MNFHQRSFSEQPSRPQQSPGLFGGLNQPSTNGSLMNSSEILHSDSQQSLDRLFNPTSMPSYPPLRDRNLPASFFSPPWKATAAQAQPNKQDEPPASEPKREHPVQSYHSRSVSYDHRSLAPHRVGNNLRNNQALGGADRATSIHLQHDNNQQQQQQQPVTSYNINNGNFVDGQYQQQQQQQQQPLSGSSNNINSMTNHQEPKFAQVHHATNNHNNQHHEPKFQVTHATNHHIHHHEPKFHVAHSTYVTTAQPVQQQLPATATIVSPFNPADQLCATTTNNNNNNEFASSASTMSHSCSNSDFHSGSCSSLHSRSQSCQSSVLESSMSNLGISGSSSDLPKDSNVTQWFDYAPSTTAVVNQQPQHQQHQQLQHQQQQQHQQMHHQQHQHHQQQHQLQHPQHPHQMHQLQPQPTTMPYGGSYSQPVLNHQHQHQHQHHQQPQQQQQMYTAQPIMNQHHHHQHFQNPLPTFHQQPASMEERRCGY